VHSLAIHEKNIHIAIVVRITVFGTIGVINQSENNFKNKIK